MNTFTVADDASLIALLQQARQRLVSLAPAASLVLPALKIE
jgi:hypothetical protein